MLHGHSPDAKESVPEMLEILHAGEMLGKVKLTYRDRRRISSYTGVGGRAEVEGIHREGDGNVLYLDWVGGFMGL